MSKASQLRGRGAIKGDGAWRTFMAANDPASVQPVDDDTVPDITTLDPGALAAAARSQIVISAQPGVARHLPAPHDDVDEDDDGFPEVTRFGTTRQQVNNLWPFLDIC